ncbi:MAG: cadherin repeat domain-containing protein, partial [Okeania sp. SIO3H1]|nr:cadherin repeat domain-containing protein [Okeania sp. SIO3H1]
WLNDGSGNFTDSQQALGRSRSYGMSLADVDGDGDIDAFVANNSQPNKVWLNNLDRYINYPPTNLALSNITINENIPDNSVVGTFSTTDTDDNTFTYQLVRGNEDTDNSAFTIDGDQLKITDSPDYETQSTYSIRVQTTDSAGGIFQKVFTLNINDINEPLTNLTLSNNTIDESEPANSVVGTFSTTDTDDDTFTYQLVRGNGDTDNSAFTIDGDQLKITDSPDYETQSTYSIRVQTTDSAGGTFQKVFTLNINETLTNLTLSNNTIDENIPDNSVVGKFSTTDTDDDTFTYQLVRGNEDTDNSAFIIDGEQLKITDSPDYQTQSTYSIRVQTNDSAGGIFQNVFTININEPPTNLTLSNNTIDENIPDNSVVGEFSTTDTDDNTFTYQLVMGNGDTDNSAFTIDGDQLKITDSPDYQTQSTYSIRVQTNDSAGGIFQKVFTININDIVEKQTCENTAQNNLVVNGSFETPV